LIILRCGIGAPLERNVMYAFHVDVPLPLPIYEQVVAELKASGKSQPAERLLHMLPTRDFGSPRSGRRTKPSTATETR
jgi:hypothetical protein